MKRRSNKSHKVPNVKLRPAQSSYSDLNGSLSQCWAEDSQTGSDDSRFQDMCPRPFRGVVVCATGVPDKTTLFKQALELGATSVLALTDRVTHLIAAEYGGAKYSVALRRKIPILSPEWISDSYAKWLIGGDLELETSVREYRLPVFSKVVLCFSGITDANRRSQIMRLVNENGGTFMKLERPVRVTHLLCSGDEQTDKMKMAEKFNSKGEADIQLVWEEWFWDSLEFGGRFEEEPYLVQNPRPERKIAEMLPSQAPDSEPSRASSLQVEQKRPAVKQPAFDMEDLEDEAAAITIVPSVRLQVWSGLLERRGYEVSEGEILRSPSKRNTEATASVLPRSDRARATTNARTRNAGSVIAAVRSTNSFAPVEQEAGPSTVTRPLPFKRNNHLASNSWRAGTPVNHAIPQSSRRPPQEPPQENVVGPSSVNDHPDSAPLPAIFAGVRICALGEARSPAVRDVVERSGGIYQEDDDNSVDFFVVRLLSGSKIYRSEPDPSMRARYRTECWLERCIHDERICLPDEHVSFSPLGITFPLPGAENIHIGLSGVDQSDTYHLRRLFRALGINEVPAFSRKATHLFCPSGVGLKFEKACEWGIPVIADSWLAAISSTGSIPPVQDYLVAGPQNLVAGSAGRVVDIKGKGKALDDGNVVQDGDARMQDITNSTPLDIHESPRAQPAHLHPEKQQTASLNKHNSLERQATTLLPAPPKGLGQTTELLGGSATSTFYADHASGKTISQATPLVRYGTRTSSSVAHTVGGSFFGRQAQPESLEMPSKEPQGTEPHREAGTPSRRASTMSIRSNSSHNDDRDIMRIPSSKSPSPMKVPIRRMSTSPVKLDAGQARKLQDSIASLLGKRQSSHEDGGADGFGGEGSNDADLLPAVKRKRPQRTKPSARPKVQRSRTTTSTRKSPATRATPPNAAGVSLGAFNPSGPVDEESQRFEEQQQSIRVVYEDPEQLQEHNRLMDMLKSGAEGEQSFRGSLSMGRTRRSVRVAALS